MSFSFDWVSFLLGVLFMAFIWPILAGILFTRNSRTAED